MKQLSILVIALGFGLAACKQGKGDRCQVNSDCDDNLVCSQATQTCADQSGTGIDAGLPDDAPKAIVDAKPDAMPDAMPDAPAH